MATDHAVDLHCHSSASFDGHVAAERLLELNALQGLTHVAITDHDTIDGALRARDHAPASVCVIVGQEARTTEGDMIGLYLERPVPSGMTPEETAAAIREQRGLVGLPHPFDVHRPSIGRGVVRAEGLARLASLVDYVEAHNSRVRDQRANDLAAEFARDFALPAVAVSDAHMEREVGLAVTVMDGALDDPQGLLDALRNGTTMRIRQPSFVDEHDDGVLARLLGRGRRQR